MKRLCLGFLALAAILLPSAAFAQCNSATPLPINTLLGRLGATPGPCQAIPMSQLGPALITSNLAVTSPLSITGLNLKITGLAGGVPNGANSAFTITPMLGVASTSTGTLTLANSGNVGTVTLAPASTATTWTFKFPTTAGANGQGLITDGSGNTSWAAGSGTVNSGTAGQLGYYATTAAALSGNANLTVSLGALTVGVAGSQAGTVLLAGGTSGATTLAGPASGGGTMTFQAGSDTVVGRATTDTLTNKTLTSPTINSATMVTPTLGVASATSINKVAITAPATSATLTIADGKTLTDTSGIGASVLLGATGGGFSAYAGGSCTNQFIRSLSVAAALTCASVANTDLTNSSVTIGSTNVSLGATASTIAGLTLTSPTINGGTAQALTNLGIRSSGGNAFDVVLANTETLTAQRTLTLTLNNAARTISLSGNLTTAAAFTTAGGNAITLTSTGTTNVTLPISGILATIDQAQTFSASNIFSALTQFTDLKFSSGKLYPTSDSTTAEQFCKADSTTCFVTVDTTNQALTAATLKFTTLDSTSLASSTSTVTGLTVNNSPNSSNDYLLYYSAADGKIRKATVGSIAAGATAGVASLNGLTGGLSIVAASGVNVAAASSSITLTGPSPFPTGRLTLTSATPVMTATVSGATTVFYTPYKGSQISIYDGTNMVLTTFTEISQATTDSTKSPAAVAASKVYDIFVWNDSGTVRATRGPAWTNSTTRGYTLTMTNGILLNTSIITNGPAALRGTWVGTIASNASSTIDYIFGAAASGGTAAVLNVWNTYNRVLTPTTVTDSGTSYTYASATIRQARASAGNQISFVIGAQEDSVIFSYSATINTGSSGQSIFGVGFDVSSGLGIAPANIQSSSNIGFGGSSSGNWAPGIGVHSLFAVESQIIGTGTFNANDTTLRNMLMATIRN